MKAVDLSIEGVDVSSPLHRTSSWTVLFLTCPLTILTHTVSTHN